MAWYIIKTTNKEITTAAAARTLYFVAAPGPREPNTNNKQNAAGIIPAARKTEKRF